jgi:hypothetical protein
MHPGAEQLQRHIEEAFALVPYPGDERIAYSRDAWECPELEADFRGRHWKSVPRETLRARSAYLPLFSAPGLHFYLPAFLLAAFEDADVRSFLLSSLEVADAGSGKEDLRDWFLRTFGSLTAPQKEAIKAFVRHMRDESRDEVTRADWSRVLEKYWDRQWA